MPICTDHATIDGVVAATVRAIQLLGRQFVTGRTIDEALANARDREARGYTFSYDMLGEAAMTAADSGLSSSLAMFSAIVPSKISMS